MSQIKRSFWVKLILLPIGMFAFAFALVPLYSVLCDITGLNGKTNGTSYNPVTQYVVDPKRKIQVDFLAATAPGFPVKFYPKVKQLEVIPGKMYTIQYIAENRSENVITGQAVPSIAPGQAAQYFKKIECFCFTKQTFQPKKPIEMPVSFIVEPDLDKSVANITLSYNFFKIKNTQEVNSNQKSKKAQQNMSTQRAMNSKG